MRKSLTSIFLILTSISAFAQHDPSHALVIEGMDKLTAICYSKSIIGYDSVVNSNVGLPPEKTILMVEGSTFKEEHPLSRLNLLITIMEAYLWEGSPSSYALKVFDDCVTNTNHSEVE